MKPPYTNVEKIFRRIDTRRLNYRFCLERDIPWQDRDKPGLHFGPAFLRLVGIDPVELKRYPQAFDAFQWAAGLEVSRSFSVLERYLLQFVDDTNEELHQSNSMEALYSEEQKHIALFERYAQMLEAQQPQWLAAFDNAFAPYKPALMNPYNRAAYTNSTLQHYFFWLKTLFFEEYTIYLDDRLQQERDLIHPVWLAAHESHRQEEQHHVVTDSAYLRALDVESSLLEACSKSFWMHIEDTFNLFLGISATRDFVRALYPQCAHIINDVPVRQMPIFQDILYHPRFKKTRKHAPFRIPMPAHIQGPVLSALPYGTLVDGFDETIRSCPDRAIILYRRDGQPMQQTYTDLHASALRALSNFPALPERCHVVLPANDPEVFLPLFWACLFGNFIPVPVGGRGTKQHRREKIRGIVQTLGDHTRVVVDQIFEDSTVHTLLAKDLLQPSAQPTPAVHRADPEDIAFVQFSSGSTASPKGIQITHRALLSNCQAIMLHQCGSSSDSFLSWLPLYHDMGLIGYHLIPLLFGAEQVLLTPTHFLKDPMHWLELLSHHQSTVTACPNFGLQYCLSRFEPQRAKGLSLDNIHCLLNGAEPINFDLITRFCAVLRPLNFNPKAMTPAYGLAEGTLCITAKPKHTSTTMIRLCREHLQINDTVVERENGAAFVACGQPIHGVCLNIVDQDGRTVNEGVVGEIEIRGRNLFNGYAPNLAAPQSDFKTGDLGVWYDGDLYILGRIKELFIQHGRNIYAVDIEQELERQRAIVAAVAYPHPEDHDVVCLAVASTPNTDLDALEKSIRRTLRATFSIESVHLRWIETKDIPRTTSGKRQRHLLTQHHSAPLKSEAAEDNPNHPTASKHSRLTSIVRQAWSQALDVQLELLEDNTPFSDYGGSSIAATHVHVLLEKSLQKDISYALLTTSNTIAQMVSFLDSNDASPALVTPPRTPQTVREQDIAIVGMSVHLANAKTLNELWSVLTDTADTFTTPPVDRWNHRDFAESLPSTKVCPTGSFLSSLFDFDPEAFGLSEREARHLNPQYRLLLQTALDAMEDAGLNRGSVGVFTSQGEAPTNFRNFLEALDKGDSNIDGLLANSTNNMLSALLSRHFDLTGPSMVVQGACASSLVAVHQACRALQHQECDAAIVGAVEILHTPTLYALFSKAGVLSPSGQCRPFTERADGFVPGEGALSLVLKPLSRASEQGDRIYAVLKGSAVGNDGMVFGQMAPNPAGQRRTIERALANAGLSEGDVEFIETHGTGTPVGDSVEIQALSSTYASQQYLGAVKSTFGHLLAGAGALSLIGSALALYHKQIPPVSNGAAFNPRLPAHNFRLPSTLQTWSLMPRRAAINALGIGGTNAHVILESAPPQDSAAPANSVLLCLGARDAMGIQRRASVTHRWLHSAAEVSLTTLAASLHRQAMPHRLRCTAVVRTKEEALQWLSRVEKDAPSATRPSKLALLFPGPGSQREQMGTTLRSHPTFAATLSEISQVAQRYNLNVHSLLDEQLPTDDIVAIQVAVFAVSVASARWLQSMGADISAVIGHSGGEYAALVVSGALSLSDGCQALIERASAMQDSPSGAMLSVFQSAAFVQSILPQANIAAYNSPEQVTLSGSHSEITAFKTILNEHSILHRDLVIPCAAHSHLMTAASQHFSDRLKGLEGFQFRSPKIPFVSSVTGRQETHFSTEYLTEQLRQPVRFQHAVETCISSGVECFLEVGGGAILSPLVRAIDSRMTTLGLRRSALSEEAAMKHVLGSLFVQGHPIRLGKIYTGEVDLPAYPFNQRQFPIPLAMEQHLGYPRPANLSPHQTLTESDLDLFSQHRIRRVGMAPAAWMLNNILRHRQQNGDPVHLERILVEQPLSPAGQSIEWRITEGDRKEILLQSRMGAWTTHLRTRISEEVPAPLCFPVFASSQDVSPIQIHQNLRKRGMLYGPDLQTIRSIARCDNQLLVHLTSSLPLTDDLVDPTLLDGVFQALAAYSLDEVVAEPFLGFSIEKLSLQGQISGACSANVLLKTPITSETDVIRCDIALQSDSGQLQLTDFTAKRLRSPSTSILHTVQWESFVPRVQRAPASICVLHRERTEQALALCDQLWADGATSVFGPYSLSQLDRITTQAGMRQANVVLMVNPNIRDAVRLAQIRKTEDQPPAILSVCLPEVAALLRSYAAEGNRVSSIVETIPVENSDILAALNFARIPTVLRHSQGQWQRPSLSPVSSTTQKQDISVAQKVYWILGGSGGIGQELCTELSNRGAITVVTSRTVSSHHGFPGDITNEEQMLNIRDQICQTHGRIDGIIHCAGLLQERKLEECTLEDIPRYTDSKELGGDLLCRLADSLDLDVLAFVSSLSSLVPSPNQALYAAANAHLDVLAHKHQSLATITKSINFGPWAEVGMVSTSPHKATWRRKGIPALSTRQAVSAFFDALCHPDPQVVVTHLSVSTERLPDLVAPLIQLLPLAPSAPTQPTQPPAPSVPQPVSTARNIGDWLRQTLAEFLHCPVENIDEDVPFSEIGVDSLMAVDVIHRMEEIFHCSLHPTLMFEFPTPSALITELKQRLPATISPPTKRPPPTSEHTISDDDVRIQVCAWGLNFIDVLGHHKIHPTMSHAQQAPGHEVSGIVVEVGRAVSHLTAGDRVMALAAYGAFSTELITKGHLVQVIPSVLSVTAGASVFVNGLTAISCVETAGRVQHGERVLIHSAAGGTGLACVQLALSKGAIVYGTIGREEKRSILEQLGVHRIINRNREDFALVLEEEGQQVDAIIDGMSGEIITKGLRILRSGGRYIEIAAGSAIQRPILDPQDLFLKGHSFHGVNLAQIMTDTNRFQQCCQRLRTLLESKVLSPQIHHRFPFAELEQALALLQSGESIGKVVLTNE